MMHPISLADLSLFPATPEQILESRKRTAIQWAKGLSVEQYIHRDIVMDAREHATNGRLTTWVLAPRADPTTLDFMCACETFRRTGIVARPSNPSEPKEAVAYGVASVFTPQDKRRNGYAQHMMRLLHWVLAPRCALPAEFPAAWGAPPKVPSDLIVGDALFSVLYSDIGKQFYRACGPGQDGGNGWLERGSLETTCTLVPAANESELATEASGSVQKWKWLTEEDTQRIWPRDADWMKADMARMAASKGRTSFSFLPDKGVGAFSIQRTMSFTSDLTPTLPLSTWGILQLPRERASLDDALSGEPVTFATWTIDTLSSARPLVTTRLRATSDTLPELLGKLVAFAQKENIKRIDLWGLSEELQKVANELGWETKERHEHLSSFRWYGEEKEDQLEWAFNEKFCWC